MREKIEEIVKEEQRKKLFYQYYELIKEWSSKINLVSRKDIEGNFLNLLKTSVFLYKRLAEYESFVDIGAGAGFPSVPGQILFPEKRFVLVEPSKRFYFLKEVIKKLSLKNTEVVKKSFLEFFSKKNRENYDIVVSWGVRNKIAMLKRGRNFVKIGYVFVTGPKEIEKMITLNLKYDFHAEKVEGKDRLYLVFAKKVPRGT